MSKKVKNAQYFIIIVHFCNIIIALFNNALKKEFNKLKVLIVAFLELIIQSLIMYFITLITIFT